MSTVLPPLFDSRPNFSPTTCGQDYGCYQSDEFEALVDEAANADDVDEQVAALQEADEELGEDYAYIPLEITSFYCLRGSKVTGFTTTPASSSYPDLGADRRRATDATVEPTLTSERLGWAPSGAHPSTTRRVRRGTYVVVVRPRRPHPVEIRARRDRADVMPTSSGACLIGPGPDPRR